MKIITVVSKALSSIALLLPSLRPKESIDEIPEQLSSRTFPGEDVVQSVGYGIFAGLWFLSTILVEAFG